MSDELILSIIFPAILFIISFMGKIKTYWRHKAANAFFVVGQHAKTKEERIGGTEILYWPAMKKQRNFM